MKVFVDKSNGIIRFDELDKCEEIQKERESSSSKLKAFVDKSNGEIRYYQV